MRLKFNCLLIALLFLLCALFACESVSQVSIVGTWYNLDGKCLDVRSDGSYKLEDGYSMGTWKYLDDNVTIEFMSVYGDTVNSKIQNDERGEFISFSSYGNFYRKVVTSGEASSTDESTPYSINLTKAGNFSDGAAWILYYDENEVEQLALINTNGKIIYKELAETNVLPDEMAGVSYIKDTRGNYKIISKDGNIVATSENADFDSVLACGDGLALVYKYSGPKDSKHLYGVINSTGELITDYIELDSRCIAAAYKGSGMFSIELSASTRWALLNTNTGRYIFIAARYLSGFPEFADGVAYFTPGYYQVPDSYEPLLDEYQMPYCALDTNFRITQTDEFGYSSSGLLIAVSEHSSAPTSLIDPETGNRYSLNYNARITNITYSGNYGLLVIQGADGNQYFTLLDRQANEQFELTEGYSVIYADEKVIYNVGGTYTIINTKGDVLADNLEYKVINEFCNGIASAVTLYNEPCYINSKGEKLLQSIHE